MKRDAAPFFLFPDVFPPGVGPDGSPDDSNAPPRPVMPVPARVDRVFHGDPALLVRPSEPVTFPLAPEVVACVDPRPFVRAGVDVMLWLAETRAREFLKANLDPWSANRWWERTRVRISRMPSLEEDVAAVLRAYLHHVVRAHLEGGDPVEAAAGYCQTALETFRRRVLSNQFRFVSNGVVREEVLYHGDPEKRVLPMFYDVDVWNLAQEEVRGGVNFRDPKPGRNLVRVKGRQQVLPLLLYDDFMDCMTQNLADLSEPDAAERLASPGELLGTSVLVSRGESLVPEGRLDWGVAFDPLEPNEPD